MTIFTGDDNDNTINGTSNNDIIDAQGGDDTVNAGNGQDEILGGAGDDTVYGGGGDDVIYGDSGDGSIVTGLDASALNLSYSNLRANSDTSSGNNNADDGDSAIYDNVATLDDGTVVYAKLVLVETSDDDLNVDLSGGEGYEILLNGSSKGNHGSSNLVGETATFRLEFYNADTDEPVSLNSVATFNDLDRNSVGDQESVTVDGSSFTAFGTSSDTSLEVTGTSSTVNAAGTETNSPDDQDAWFSAEFEGQTSITFTLETRSTQSGFSMNGDLIEDAIVTELEAGNDTLFGGSGQDTIYGEDGDDTIDGGDGDDDLYGGNGEDTITGGQGQDEIYGGDGNDVLSGGSGDDKVYGEEGDDTLIADGDNDTLDGGTGNDTFELEAAGNTTIIGGEDADGNDIDTIDLTGLGADYASVNINYTNNDPSTESGTIELLDANGNITRRVTFSEIEQIICFTPGTGIATQKGEIMVEDLKSGDKVFTRDNGAQAITWIGQKHLSAEDLQRQKDLTPILIQKGALGNGLPERDLMVSPQHRVLIASDRAALYFEEREVLAAAKHLIGFPGISYAKPLATTYVHFMCENHEVILSNGSWTETFQPGVGSMAGLAAQQRDEIFTLFPELKTTKGLGDFTAARKSLKKHEAKLLLVE